MESPRFWHALSTIYSDKTSNLIMIMKISLIMFMTISSGNVTATGTGTDHNNNNYSYCSYYKKITHAVVCPTPRSTIFIF